MQMTLPRTLFAGNGQRNALDDPRSSLLPLHYRQTRDGGPVSPKRAGKSVSGDAGAYAGGGAPSPEERESQLETLQLLDSMLDGLNGKTREAFLLSQLDGLTYSEIAHKLGVSISSVKNTWRKPSSTACCSVWVWVMNPLLTDSPPSGAAFSFPLVCRAKRRARQPTTGSALATVV